MAGGASHLDLFDYKPELVKRWLGVFGGWSLDVCVALGLSLMVVVVRDAAKLIDRRIAI